MAFVTGVAAVGARGARGVAVSRAPRQGAARVAARVVMMSDLQQKISDAIKGAEEATSKFGKGSKEAAVAWDTVEELEAEASHQKASNAKKDPLEEYCDEAPEADECRTYDN